MEQVLKRIKYYGYSTYFYLRPISQPRRTTVQPSRRTSTTTTTFTNALLDIRN
jgi:hypothetical protein